MKIKNFFLLGLFFISTMVMAQERQVTGTITDSDGLPLIGVNIIFENTSRGTQSDFDGNYSITANQGEVLVYSFVGFSTVRRTLGSEATINVQMLPDETLDEVVVVGYGTQSKRKVTDNIASISSEQINNIPVSNMQSSLVGKAAGVQITQINGKVEGGVKMRIRGISSIS